MIDIHCHILPNIDDGAKNMYEAVEMARIAYEEGITRIAATPHYIEPEECLFDEVNRKVKELDSILKEEKIDLEILTGNEVYITPYITKLIKNRHINTINNTKYLLIELPFLNIPNYAEDVIFALKLEGIIPIIAHPERCTAILENPNILVKYIDMGALCQINSGSITGHFGKKIMEASHLLLAHNMVHFAASDAHSSRIRAPRLKKAYEKVKSLWGEERAEELFNSNPQKIIDGKDIDIVEPKIINEKSKIEKLFHIFKFNSKRIQ